MSHANALVNDFLRRTGNAPDMALDAAYQIQMTTLRQLFSLLEVVLEDEGVEPDKRARILRCMLYGAPSEADAELRINQQQEMVKLLENRPVSMIVDKDIFEQLGLPRR